MCEQRFFICPVCGNIVGMIRSSGVPVFCCGKKMLPLEANTVEASKEKHIPVVTIEGDTVKVNVGSAAHPMTEEHHIEWVYVQTCHGGQRKCLKAGEAPEVSFTFNNDKPKAVYAYCNLHGLWKAEL